MSRRDQQKSGSVVVDLQQFFEERINMLSAKKWLRIHVDSFDKSRPVLSILVTDRGNVGRIDPFRVLVPGGTFSRCLRQLEQDTDGIVGERRLVNKSGPLSRESFKVTFLNRAE